LFIVAVGLLVILINIWRRDLMKRMYKAFIYLNDDKPITMIVGGSSRKYIIEVLTDFYRKISGAAEIDIKLKEVEYYDGNYRYK